MTADAAGQPAALATTLLLRWFQPAMLGAVPLLWSLLPPALDNDGITLSWAATATRRHGCSAAHRSSGSACSARSGPLTPCP